MIPFDRSKIIFTRREPFHTMGFAPFSDTSLTGMKQSVKPKKAPFKKFKSFVALFSGKL